MKGVLARFAVLALLLIGAPVLAQDSPVPSGEERILSFVSDVKVERSGDLDVTETIRFLVTGAAINHGINRDFPTRYPNRFGETSTVKFTLVSVQRDGASDDYQQSYMSNGVRVRIGKPDVTIAPGEHVYVIRYRTSRQILYRAGEDELYWNATGNGWDFAIDSAEARITLPTPARFGRRFAYTGPQGSKASDATVIDDRPGYIAFRTNGPLPKYGGLTVAADFPRDAIDIPTSNRQLGWWLQDWAGLWAGLLSLIGMVGYYIYAWRVAGRGPRAGTMVPLFAPPEGLSAAGVRYISRAKLDNRGFTAAIVQLGVLGQLRIRKVGESGWFKRPKTVLERTRKDMDVPVAEGLMLSRLFAGNPSIELEQDNHAQLQAARTALETQLQAQYAKTMFASHTGWAVNGLLAVFGCILAIAFVAMLVRDPMATTDELTIPALGAGFLAGAIWIGRIVARTEGSKCLLWGGIVMGYILAATFTLGAIIQALAGGEVAVLFPLLIIPLSISAFVWMAAPTVEGRRVMDQIAGFKHYLGVAEEQRLDRMNPPEKTPELFERYLPYAIALDVENRWAARFAGVLAAAAAAGATADTMGWYSGGGNAWDDPGGFVADVGGSLNSTISSASASPSSSDSGGSDGGGSSGGGGGGGGGSGW